MDSGGWLERRPHTKKGKGDKAAQASEVSGKRSVSKAAVELEFCSLTSAL